MRAGQGVGGGCVKPVPGLAQVPAFSLLGGRDGEFVQDEGMCGQIWGGEAGGVGAGALLLHLSP